jgi:hypothetical protein
MRKVIFLILMMSFISCNKEKYYKEEIVGGDWKLIPEEPIHITDEGDTVKLINSKPPSGFHVTYSFLNEDTYEDKRGFFESVNRKTSHNHSRIHYLGNISKYEIKANNLRLYHLGDKKWDSYEIVSLKADTLCLKVSSEWILKFKRKIYDFENKDSFDKVIISSSGCYGSCPVGSILIDKSGEIVFEGLGYTTELGLYKSKITKVKFGEIVKSFQKADWKNLKDEYEAGHTDDERISIVFIKNNKIIKAISDYGHESPEEFIWAYQPLRYMYQQLKLQKIDEKTSHEISDVELLRRVRNYPVPKPKVN